MARHSGKRATSLPFRTRWGERGECPNKSPKDLCHAATSHAVVPLFSLQSHGWAAVQENSRGQFRAKIGRHAGPGCRLPAWGRPPPQVGWTTHHTFPSWAHTPAPNHLPHMDCCPPPPEGLMHDTAAQSHPSLNRRRPRGHLGAAHFPRVEWVGGSWLAFELHQEGAWPSPLSLPLTVSDAWRPTGPSSHWWGLMEPPKPDSRMPEGNCGTFENGCKLSGSEDSTALENHPGGGVGVGGASLSLGHVDSWKEAWAGYPQPPVVQPPA